MPDLLRDGVRLHYEDAGSGDAMVLVHGWCCDLRFMAPQASHFAKGGRVMSLDLRGHGESDKPRQRYSIEGHADDVAWLCGELGLARPVVVGHSMGGAVALALAAARPELARAIVMLDGAILPSAELLERADSLARAFGAPDYLQDLRAMVDRMFMEPDDAERRAWITDAMLEAPRHVVAAEWRALWAFDSISAAAKCVVPAMYVGSQSPVADMATLRRLMPGLIAAQTAGAGHFHQLEVPEQVNAMIERFLAIVA